MTTTNEEIAELKAQVGQLSVAVEILAGLFISTMTDEGLEIFRQSLLGLTHEAYEFPTERHSGFFGRDFGEIDIGPVMDCFLGMIDDSH